MKNNGINISDWANALSNQKLFYMAVLTENGHMTFVNSHFFKTFHRPAESVNSKNFFDSIHPQDVNKLKVALEQARTSEQSIAVEIRLKSGHYSWVKWEISCVHKPASELKTYLCLGYDIPREEQVRKYISIDYQNYQAIVEGLNIGVIFQDKDGFVISANQKIAEILDTTLENLYNNNKIYSVWNTCDGNGVPLLSLIHI